MVRLASKGFDAVESEDLDGDDIMVVYRRGGEEEVIFSTLQHLKRLIRDYPIQLVVLSSAGFEKLESLRRFFDAGPWVG